MKLPDVIFDVKFDKRGCLIALESNRNIPFDIKRVYYMFELNEERRGFHAHKSLKQMLVCVSGSCKVLLDDGTEKIEYVLDNPAKGLYIAESIWHEMYDFSKDAVLVVLASDYYNESDYIRNYDKFREYLNEIEKA